jgi:DNA-binding PadR family transcriptional regulator
MPGKKIGYTTKLLILKIIHEKNGIRVSEILKELRNYGRSIKEGTLWKNLDDLKNMGKIRNPKRGFYEITPDGIKSLLEEKLLVEIGKTSYEKVYREIQKGDKREYTFILGINATYHSLEPKKIIPIIFSETTYATFDEKARIEQQEDGWSDYFIDKEDHIFVSIFYYPGVGINIRLEKEIPEIVFLCGLMGPDQNNIIDMIKNADENAPYQFLASHVGIHIFLIDSILRKNGSNVKIKEINIGELEGEDIVINKIRKFKPPKDWDEYKNELFKLSRFRKL